MKLVAIVNSEESERCIGACTSLIARRMRSVQWVRPVSAIVKPMEVLWCGADSKVLSLRTVSWVSGDLNLNTDSVPSGVCSLPHVI